jgi:hypothetical protein
MTSLPGAGLCGKEICDLLITLEVANLGYGKELACVLVENA